MTHFFTASECIRRASERVVLRTLAPTDFEPLLQVWADPEVMRYMAAPLMTRDQARDKFEAMLRPDKYVRESYRFAVERTQDGAVVGTLSADRERFDTAYAHSMYLSRDSWGSGFGREALALVLRFCFEDLAARRVWSACAARNERAKRLVESLGYTWSGTIRGYAWRGEERIDCDAYSCLREEWRAAMRPDRQATSTPSHG